MWIILQNSSVSGIEGSVNTRTCESCVFEAIRSIRSSNCFHQRINHWKKEMRPTIGLFEHCQTGEIPPIDDLWNSRRGSRERGRKWDYFARRLSLVLPGVTTPLIVRSKDDRKCYGIDTNPCVLREGNTLSFSVHLASRSVDSAYTSPRSRTIPVGLPVSRDLVSGVGRGERAARDGNRWSRLSEGEHTGGSRSLDPSLPISLTRGVVIVAVVVVMGGCTSKDTTSSDQYVSAGKNMSVNAVWSRVEVPNLRNNFFFFFLLTITSL